MARPRRKLPALRNILILAAALSAFQYATQGQVSWPMDAWRSLGNTLGDYGTRPDAGWRQATEVLEKVGAAREGQPLPDFDLRGRVVRVADGDTVSILDGDNKQHKVRLFGIDTPERDQAYGKAAKKALAALVADKQVAVQIMETDSYGRTVGTLYLQDSNINAAMVQSGYAWWYRHYAPNNRLLAAMEQQAREKKRGLWADPEPMPPWDWRRQQRYQKSR